MNTDEYLSSNGIQLPSAPLAAGLYKPMMIVGDLAYLSGHLPILEDGQMMLGSVGQDRSIEEGHIAARQVGLNMLATLKAGLGSLNRVVRVIKLLGLVQAPSGFTQHPQVVNGCSELFKNVFGDDYGVGTRSALGVSGLPGGVMVEIEGVFQIRE
ncbi:MAG: RidA family protein [Opitutales bacterium]|nr:RidA family protein [Opitutales bacterium]